MDLLEVMLKRRSVRKCKDEKISEDDLIKILQAGLTSASSKALRPWEFIVVEDKENLRYLSECRSGSSSKMLEEAAAAIIVIGDAVKADMWVEDCSVVMTNMHLMASNLGIGSCWIQGRTRMINDNLSTEEYVRNRFKFPENFKLEAILSLGISAIDIKPYELEKLPMEKIHREKF